LFRHAPMVLFRLILCGLLASHALAATATAEVGERAVLRVCSDPANLPFSNKKGEGFENKIADLIAAEIGARVEYTWFPQSIGFIRNTLRARRCDVVMGISLANELVLNTNPYYRSTYALVYRADAGLTAISLSDPALKAKRLGVVVGTPPASVMARNGLMANARPYNLQVDTRVDLPGKRMVQDVADGTIDAAVVWGPIAGYHAKDHNPPLEVVPLRSPPHGMKMDYRITMGVRQTEVEWKRQLNTLIQKLQPDIDAILHDYGVPILDEKGNLIRP
jgi:mxaJ protein